MLLSTIHRDIKIFLDKVDSSAYPEFEDGEIDVFINEGIKRLVNQKYGGNNPLRTSFEETQKRTEDLKSLVVTKYFPVVLSTVYTSPFKVYKTNLDQAYSDSSLIIPSPEKYLFFTKCVANVIENNCNSFAKIKQIQQDDLTEVILDPFNKPKGNKVVSFFEEGTLCFAVDTVKTLEKVLITYIKKPALVNKGTYGFPLVECDLDEHLHSEVIQVTVGIMLENIESQRQNTQEVLNTQRIE